MEFSESGTKFVFFLLFLFNLGINFDHGAVPAATKVLQEDLDLNAQQLGSLGSMVFMGLLGGK